MKKIVTAENTGTKEDDAPEMFMQTVMEGIHMPESETEKQKAYERRRRFLEALPGGDVISDAISLFLKMFCVTSILTLCGIVKNSTIGCSSVFMFAFLIKQSFAQYSIYRSEQMGLLPKGISTSSVSRFLSNPKYRWETFLAKLSAAVWRFIDPLTGPDHKKAFIGDDSDIDRKIRSGGKDEWTSSGKHNKKKKTARKHKGKRTEYVSRKYDHARKVYSQGFRMLTLGWTDSTTYIPLGFSLLASTNPDKILGDKNASAFKKNSTPYMRRNLAVMPTLNVLITLISRAIKCNITARHLCVDRWFSNPSQIYDVKKQTGLEVITVVKHNSTKYVFNGEEMTITEIYRYVRKHYKTNADYCEYTITVPGKNGNKNQTFQAKVVFVKNRSNKRQWIAILSTDISLSAEDIIQYYGLRWKTEIYFWTAKMFLGLNSDCHALSYDAITAHATIVAVRFMMLSVEQRKKADQRTLGDLVALITEEIRQASVGEILQMFADSVFSAVEKTFHPTEEQMAQFTANLIANLPSDIVKLLNTARAYDDDDPGEKTRKQSKKKGGGTKKAQKTA